jgi:hypothetical protein
MQDGHRLCEVDFTVQQTEVRRQPRNTSSIKVGESDSNALVSPQRQLYLFQR